MLGTSVLAADANQEQSANNPNQQASQQAGGGVQAGKGTSWQPENTAHPGGKLPKDVSVQLVQVAAGFVDPIHVTSPHDGTGRLFVCERPGIIRIIDKDGKVMEDPF